MVGSSLGLVHNGMWNVDMDQDSFTSLNGMCNVECGNGPRLFHIPATGASEGYVEEFRSVSTFHNPLHKLECGMWNVEMDQNSSTSLPPGLPEGYVEES